MKFQIASDLHLEFYTESGISFDTLLDSSDAAETILILAGDIGYPEDQITKNFLEWCCDKWKYIVWIYGNHEYYTNSSSPLTMDEKEQKGIQYRFPNLKLLLDEPFDIPQSDLTVYGTTFWTELEEDDLDIQYRLNDFKKIYLQPNRKLNVYVWNEYHRASKEDVKGILDKAQEQGRRAIIITHHLPSYTMIQECYQGHPLNAGFASHSDSLLHHPAVALWACGHSHGFMKNGKCILNARGYPREESNTTYDRKCIVKI